METRLRLAVKLVGLFLTVAAGSALLVAPVLFTWILGGRYSTGMSVLPGTLLYCLWFCLTCIAMSYLLCAEVAHLGSLALLVGLGTNVLLNYLLAPRYGLTGVVIATAAANAVALWLVIWLSSKRGMHWDRGLYVVALLPASLLLGGIPSLAIVLVVLLAAWQAGWIFGDDEATQLGEFCDYALDRWMRMRPRARRAGLEEAQC